MVFRVFLTYTRNNGYKMKERYVTAKPKLDEQ